MKIVDYIGMFNGCELDEFHENAYLALRHLGLSTVPLRIETMAYEGTEATFRFSDDKSFTPVVRLAPGEMNLFANACHEFVHVKQYYDGRLSLCGDGFVFERRMYSRESVLPRMVFEDYVNLPWEREAYQQMYAIPKQIGVDISFDPLQAWHRDRIDRALGN